MTRALLVGAGALGALAVGLGAFGAHGLEGYLADASDAAKRLGWWETAAFYHLTHALAVGLSAWVASRGPSRSASVAGLAFVLGISVFSGTLYAMALGAPRVLGAITPIGGVALIVGWTSLAVAGWKTASESR